MVSNLEVVAEELRERESGSLRSTGLLQAIDEARQGAERARQIVRRLKTFSRAEHDRRSPQDAHRLIEAAVSMTMNEVRHRASLVKDFGAVPLQGCMGIITKLTNQAGDMIDAFKAVIQVRLDRAKVLAGFQFSQGVLYRQTDHGQWLR